MGMGLARKFGLFFIIISRSICTFLVVGGGKLAQVVGLNFIFVYQTRPSDNSFVKLFLFLQIYVPPKKRIENGFLFKLMCPGYGFNKFHEKVFMSNDGYVLKNSTFNDYCNAKLVKIAFNNVRI